MKTGGAAFPLFRPAASVQTSDGGYGWGEITEQGMTLRDYFAAAALQGLLSALAHPKLLPDQLCRDAFIVADAMLQARDK